MLHAASLDGPWTRVPLDMSGWDWTDVNLGLESHAPVVLDNGTVLTLTRSWGTPVPYPNSAFWLVAADKWDGHYAKVAGAPQPFLNVTMEDSFMWRDEAGHFHALFHKLTDKHPSAGGHAYSRDGWAWTLTDTAAFTTDVRTDDGTTPLALFTSLTNWSSGAPTDTDKAFTFAQSIAS